MDLAYCERAFLFVQIKTTQAITKRTSLKMHLHKNYNWDSDGIFLFKINWRESHAPPKMEESNENTNRLLVRSYK